MTAAGSDDAAATEQENPRPKKRSKPWPRHWLLRFVKAARLNYRVSGTLGPSVRVAWKDARRHRASVSAGERDSGHE